MAQTMKRLGVYLGLVEDDPHYGAEATRSAGGESSGYSESYRTLGTSAAAPAPVRSVDPQHSPLASLRRDPAPAASPATAADPAPGVDPYAIHTIHPRSYNDARRIGEEYRSGSPVIMNLTEMNDADAKRIVDFAAGLVFAMHGSIERVTQKVFLLSPQNVDVRDAPAVQQARDGFFNQS